MTFTRPRLPNTHGRQNSKRGERASDKRSKDLDNYFSPASHSIIVETIAGMGSLLSNLAISQNGWRSTLIRSPLTLVMLGFQGDITGRFCAADALLTPLGITHTFSHMHRAVDNVRVECTGARLFHKIHYTSQFQEVSPPRGGGTK